MVVQCGDGLTTSEQVIEGIQMTETKSETSLGGRDLTYYLQQLLKEQGVDVDFETARILKEQNCSVALNID